MINLRFSKTERNKVVLISEDGYSYIRHRSAADERTEYWTCEQRRICPGRGISGDNRRQFRQTKEHTHLPDATRAEMRTIKANMKQSAADAIGANTTTNVLQAALLVASSEAKARLPRVDNLKRTIQRSRNRQQCPLPLPQSRDDINIPLQFQFTGSVNQPEQFLLWDSGRAIAEEPRILMFGTQQNLSFLRSCNGILMDGTFKTTPHHFLQLYTIHGTRLEAPSQKPGKAVPLIFFLLPDKTEATYRRAFTQLSLLLPGWVPDRMMLDFERAAFNAVRGQWPNSQINFCFFHLNQNIWKKIQVLGLSPFYGEDVENATNLKMISALAFIPPEEVVNSWIELLQILQPWIQQQTLDVQQKIDDLLIYFETNYIGQNIAGVRREPRVAAIELWNVRMRTLEHYGRTDNEVEGFHTKVAHTTGAQFPNFWKFLKGLQGLQVETEKLIEEMNSGIVGRKQRPQYVRLAERIANVTATWHQRQNLETYLRGISHNFVYGGHG